MRLARSNAQIVASTRSGCGVSPTLSQPLTIQLKMAWCCAPGATGCALRRTSRCDQPSRLWYFTAWTARRPASMSLYQRANARIVPRPQPPSAFTYSAKWNRCVPMRATRGSAACAARRVGSSPSLAASASANSAGSFLGARPACDTSTMRATTRAPSAAMQRRTASALSRVSFCSDA